MGVTPGDDSGDANGNNSGDDSGSGAGVVRTMWAVVMGVIVVVMMKQCWQW